jgi:hypothetical protein
MASSALVEARLLNKQGASDAVLVTPKPSGHTEAPGVTESQVMEMNELGYRRIAENNIDEISPILTLTYGKYTPEIEAIKRGLQLALQATPDAPYQRSFLVDQASFPAAPAGTYGAGVAADSLIAFYNEGGLSRPLTRQPFATFDPTTPDTFANDADAALLVSNNIQNVGGRISVYGTYNNANSLVLTANPWTVFDILLISVDTFQGLKRVKTQFIPNAQLSIQESSDINFEEDPTIAFRLPVQCQPDIMYHNLQTAC